ncbi:MAG TPA: hypothetical protein VM490_09310 [Armatimonadaceae bacterium]|jgi:hypothetical protein|nr:hypothetical protein [Armatimonadaceae bacterium]
MPFSLPFGRTHQQQGAGEKRGNAAPSPAALPRLDHVRAITDDTGMFQHSIGGVADAHTGYTTDDNARAFLAMVRLWRRYPEERAQVEPLLRVYVRFLLFAQRREDGWFRNFFSYARAPLDERGTEDCLGRCLWALAEAEAGDLPDGTRFAVRQMLQQAKEAAHSLHSPRALAYAALGLTHLADDHSRALVRTFADRYLALWDEYSGTGWRWFEPILSYDNARMVEALLRAADTLDEDRYRRVGREALDWLTEHSFHPQEGYLEPIGNRGWWRKGGEKTRFDQQTIEAGAYAELYAFAADSLEDASLMELSERAGEWFWGRNAHSLPVYVPETGGCRDALTEDGVNLNQGAESVLSYLLASTPATR